MTERLELPAARIITARELNQRTAAVLEEVNRSGRPALVSRHGQFIAMITPLADRSVESVVFAEDPDLRDQLAAADDGESMTVAEARARLRDGSSESRP